MNRFSAMVLALAMIFTASGCSEANSNTEPNEIAAAVSAADSSFDTADVKETKLSDISMGGDSSEDNNKDSSREILTPATTEAEAFLKTKYTDYSYFSKAQGYDYIDKVRYWFEGEITDEDTKREIFEKLCSLISSPEITPVGEQSIQGGAASLLTLKTADGKEYGIGEGILIQHPGEEGGTALTVFKTPHSILYLGTDYEKCSELYGLISEGVKTESNIVRKESDPEPAETKPVLPLTYVTVRTGYNEVLHVSGTFVDSAGMMYAFDLTDYYESAKGSVEEVVFDALNNGIGEIICMGASLNTELLNEGIRYAEQIGDDVVFSEKEKLMDYGQNTLYAAAGEKLVMLCSEGDVDKFTDDVNVQGAIEYYKRAYTKAVELQDQV